MKQLIGLILKFLKTFFFNLFRKKIIILITAAYHVLYLCINIYHLLKEKKINLQNSFLLMNRSVNVKLFHI